MPFYFMGFSSCNVVRYIVQYKDAGLHLGQMNFECHQPPATFFFLSL